MVRLGYLFWVVPMFLLAACAREPRPAPLVYTQEFLRGETATASPAGLIFDPPYLAATTAFGRCEIGGIDLNDRARLVVAAPWRDASDAVDYTLYYSDRQSRCGTRTGHHGGYLRRTFRYYRYGRQFRYSP